MKKLILTGLTLLLMTTTVFSQPGGATGYGEGEEDWEPEYYMGGDWEIGGWIWVKYRGSDVYNTNPDYLGKSIMIIDDVIDAGYFPMDKLSVGAMLLLQVWKRGDETGTDAAMGPRVRYYIPAQVGPGFPYFQLSALFGAFEHVTEYDAQFDADHRYEFGAGYSIPLNEHVSLSTLLFYSMDSIDPPGPNNATSGSRMGLRVGFNFFHF